MEPFSASLAFRAGNSAVTGTFTSQKLSLKNSIGPIARNCRNDHRATIFVGQTCILKIRATNVFLCQLAAHCTPYALLILRGVLQSACHLMLNLPLFTMSMISYLLYLVWFYDHLIIEPWYDSRQRYHGSCRNGHSVRLQNLYCLSTTRLWLNTRPWSGLLMS